MYFSLYNFIIFLYLPHEQVTAYSCTNVPTTRITVSGL
nr:MAG TPA: hypothetical protein [Caudoviricetes sp.]